jgi:hypothetical protein
MGRWRCLIQGQYSACGAYPIPVHCFGHRARWPHRWRGARRQTCAFLWRLTSAQRLARCTPVGIPQDASRLEARTQIWGAKASASWPTVTSAPAPRPGPNRRCAAAFLTSGSNTLLALALQGRKSALGQGGTFSLVEPRPSGCPAVPQSGCRSCRVERRLNDPFLSLSLRNDCLGAFALTSCTGGLAGRARPGGACRLQHLFAL